MNNIDTDWTLEQGIDFVRQLEKEIERIYNHYHVAIGGSTLHKGLSNKDLDVFIYPHKTGQMDRTYLDKKLVEFGLVEVRHCTPKHQIYGDEKEVIEFNWQGKRVDIFFLQ